jgi:hypothetical protein
MAGQTRDSGRYTAPLPRLAGGQAAARHRRRPPGTAAAAAPFAARWPRQSLLELGALPGAVPCARLHARLVLWEWGLAAVSDSAELVVSELLTNGVRASRAAGQAAVRMWLVSDRAQIVVFAWDASPQPPAPAEPGQDAESGRGLRLIEAITSRWGHFGYDSGKVVWAAVPATGHTQGLPLAFTRPLRSDQPRYNRRRSEPGYGHRATWSLGIRNRGLLHAMQCRRSLKTRPVVLFEDRPPSHDRMGDHSAGLGADQVSAWQ